MSASVIFISPAPFLKSLSFGSVPFLLSFDLNESYLNKDLPELKDKIYMTNKILEDDPVLDIIIEVFKIDDPLVDTCIVDIDSTIMEIGAVFTNYLNLTEEDLFSKIDCDF